MGKRRKLQIRTFSILSTLIMIFSLILPGMTVAAQADGKVHHALNDSKAAAKEKMSNRLQDVFKEQDKVTFLVKFKEKADTNKAATEGIAKAQKANLSGYRTELMQRSSVISALKTTSIESQQDVKTYVEQEIENGNADEFNSYYIVNGMAVTATKEVAKKIAAFAEVEKILPNETRELFSSTIAPALDKPKADVADDVEWNVDRVAAPQAWDMGVDGTGTVVASIDTGVQWDHAALKEKYRGYDEATGEVNHDYNWFDATVGNSVPYDDQGHGTHVTGTMVGGEPSGSNQVGVAPGAEWIAVKAFTEDGGSDTDLLAAAEWIMAPTDADGNERVDMAPDVVNNSWGGGAGLDEWYRDVVIAWRNANIFPEFSAGNTTLLNPGGPGSIANPANYPESFATGATDIDDNLAEFSLRGPSPYDEIKPDISAPGVNIRSSVPGDGYANYNGTSMSGPAVSAVAAMLKQADPNLTVDDMEEILLNTAIPMTDGEYPESPNNGYGYGLVNAYEAVSTIVSGLGTIEGVVTKDGEDTEAPEFNHEGPSETYTGMDLNLEIDVTDNVSVTSVELTYNADDGQTETVEAERIAGDFKDGSYKAVIPGDAINGSELTYSWTINDFGNNEVTSDAYVVEIKEGISHGYFEDFEAAPAGWYSFGDNDSWERGVPTSGPEEAVSGENVYATNLSGKYDNNMDATLAMPPVTLPEGETYLQFEHWYDLEIFSSGNAYDFGYVVVSTDGENWTQVTTYEGLSDGWESAEVDLSEYSGQTIFVGFQATSDFSGTYDGWYIDDVGLSATSNASKVSNGLHGSNQVQPVKEDSTSLKDEANRLSSLPMRAQVTVLETERSTTTDPATGGYSMKHAPGDYTVKAEAYGFASEEQAVEVVDEGTATANFNLQELPTGTVTGTVTHEKTGEPIEGATLLLKEDANIAPVETDANGAYSLTAYEGEYTLKVMAQDFHSTEVSVVIDGSVTQDITLEPFYTIPGGEIGYDDGTAENARAFYDAGNGWAVKMSLPEGKEQAVVTDGVFQFHDTDFPSPGDTPFAVEVWSAGEDGMPDEKLAGPIDAEAIRDLDQWTVVDLRDENIIVDGDFFMLYRQTDDNPFVPGLATDESSPNAGRSYQVVSGTWSQSPADEGNYMIRARVAYEVGAPEITSPEEGKITNEPSITVEGTASPETTVKLINNNEEVDSQEIGDDGQFAIDVSLTEGDNELKAVAMVNGEEAKASEPVNVTLDTELPELTIDSPQDGDKTNRETATVEGNVSDEHLDTVTVNGQEANVAGDGSYSKRILLDPGENQIEVIATDLAGNAVTKTVTINAKYTAPEISNLTPTEDKDLKAGQSVKIEFDSEPGLNATFSILMPLTNVGAQVSNAIELPMMETSEGHYVGYWTARAM
ncbi:Bacillopeptidase [Lentibacillus sp. JNUCC-1]|nr:Bacillopeptidase [Lentibacillus sp. JNUCC-1]